MRLHGAATSGSCSLHGERCPGSMRNRPAFNACVHSWGSSARRRYRQQSGSSNVPDLIGAHPNATEGSSGLSEVRQQRSHAPAASVPYSRRDVPSSAHRCSRYRTRRDRRRPRPFRRRRPARRCGRRDEARPPSRQRTLLRSLGAAAVARVERRRLAGAARGVVRRRRAHNLSAVNVGDDGGAQFLRRS